MFNSNKPLVLLLGEVDREGVTSKLASIGRKYKKKVVNSSVGNWQSILKCFDEATVGEVIAKLTPHTYELIASEAYRDISEELFRRISQISNIVFVHESLLVEDESLNYEKQKYEARSPSWEYCWEPLENSLKKFVNETLESSGLNIVPYKKNVELTILALTFIDQFDQNILFRIYIPSNRIWTFEIDKLIQLFRDYLSKVSNLNIRLDQYRTDQGIAFEFHGDEKANDIDVSKEFNEFSIFLDLCVSNFSDAETLLRNKNLDPELIYDLLERYSKEAKRIITDLKHERERKLLGVRHRLESELVDVVPSDFDWQIINSLVDSTIPRLDGVSSVLGTYRSPLQLNSASNLAANINSQIVGKVENIVAQEVFGEQYIGKDTKELLDLIQKHGGSKAAGLTSAVYELADKSSPQLGRLTARQKLKKFLLNVSNCIGDSSIGALQAYVESQLDL